jgi:hypothetical protein
MDYSPLLPRSESPIEMNDHSPMFGSVLDDISNFCESEDEHIKNDNIKSSKGSESKKNKSGGEKESKSKLFGRSLSKSKSVTESEYIEDAALFNGKKKDFGEGKKMSSPIEIKGSPGKSRGDENNRKGSSSSTENHHNNHHNHSSSRISFFKVLTRRNSSANQGKHKSKNYKPTELSPH